MVFQGAGLHPKAQDGLPEIVIERRVSAGTMAAAWATTRLGGSPANPPKTAALSDGRARDVEREGPEAVRSGAATI
jgi:hypothetical protein